MARKRLKLKGGFVRSNDDGAINEGAAAIDNSKNKIPFYFFVIIIILLMIFYLIFLEMTYQLHRKNGYPSSSVKQQQQHGSDSNQKQAIWFSRKMSPNNSYAQLKKEWDENRYIKRPDINNLWIPLNENDSEQLEAYWTDFVGYNTCRNPSSLFDKPKMVLMDGLYTLFEAQEEFFTLQPIYWRKEREYWIVYRCECVYEISSSPPPLYFKYIKIDLNKLSVFYQPAPCELPKSKKYDSSFINNSVPENVYHHLILVVHGIGHHKGEEGIVENTNQIRDGFMLLKKFHPNHKSPMVIPIPWRYNLSLNDESFHSIHLMKDENMVNLGLSINDVIYYLGGYAKEIKIELIQQLKMKYQLFKQNHPLFDGKVSILAHSLGTVITFDILNESSESLGFEVTNLFFIGSPLPLFLSARNITGETLRQNKWIKNNRLFNILHSNDPISFRMEPLLYSYYQFTDPFSMNFHRYFRSNYWKSADATDNEVKEVRAFYQRLVDDGERVCSHNSFLIRKFSSYDVKALYTHNNVIFPKYFLFKWSTNPSSSVWHYIPDEKRIRYRIDYDIHKPELDYYVESLLWGKEFLFAHSSYWQRPELISLISSIFYNCSPPADTIVHSPYATLKPNMFYSDYTDFFNIDPLTFFLSFFFFLCILWACISVFFSIYYFYFRRPDAFIWYYFDERPETIHPIIFCILIVIEILLIFLYMLLMSEAPFTLLKIIHIVNNLDLPNYVIYAIVFIPATIRFLLIDRTFSFKYSSWVVNVVLTIQAFKFFLYFYLTFVDLYRSINSKCRHTVDGYCLQYMIYENQYPPYFSPS